jgi:hypothetical protein
VDCTRRNHDQQTAFGQKDPFIDLHVGVDGQSQNATGLRLDAIEGRANRRLIFLYE